MNIIREKKNEIRAKFKQLRRDMDPILKKQYDAAVCKRILDLASFRYSEILLMYSPLKGEIDISPLISEALSQGKRIAFPRCDKDTSTMSYHFIKAISDLEPGAMGILEPRSDLPIYDPVSELTTPTLCLVPALVYDRGGYRLGYGKGYYDRFLPEYRGAKIGLIYTDFIVDYVPRGKFDICVDVLVTEKGVKAINAD